MNRPFATHAVTAAPVLQVWAKLRAYLNSVADRLHVIQTHMPRLKWSQRALMDVARLHDFLAAKSRDAAKRAIKAIRQGMKALGKHPESGRPVEEMSPEFREWVIEFGNSAYVALYHYDGKQVVILAGPPRT